MDACDKIQMKIALHSVSRILKMKITHVGMTILLLVALTACASPPTAPSTGDTSTGNSTPIFSQSMEESGRHLLGMWELVFDFENLTAEAIPQRFSSGHFNVRKFMEEGPCYQCLTLYNFTPQPDESFTIDVHFQHPFPGLDNFSGFDVRGTAIFNGSYVFPSSGLVMSDHTMGDMELLNADGFTSVFNPINFPEGSGPGLLTYSKGEIATPLVNPATLNGYKNYYTEPIRRLFTAGESVMQNYHIAKPTATKIRVGYVVDASWAVPDVKPVEDPLNDFPIEANCTEAYEVSVNIGMGMMPGCGFAPYTVDVWDWQGHITVDKLTIEAPDLISGILENTSPVDMGDYTRFTGNIPNELEVDEGEYRVLFGVVDNVLDPFLGEMVAYAITTATVDFSPIDYDISWRKDGKTLDNNNYNPHETTIGLDLSETWSHQFSAGVGAVFESTPTIGMFGVYYTVSVPYAQKIWAFDVESGLPIWDMGIKFQPDNVIYASAPLVGNCEVYVGGSSVFSFDAEDGDLLWSFEGDDTQYTQGSPVMSNGVLVVWGFDNTLYAFDSFSGAFLWDYTVEEFPGCPGTPAVQDGVVYGGDARGNAFALNISDGSEIWQVSFPAGGPATLNEILAAPVIADGLVWIGSMNCNLYGLNMSTGITEQLVPLNDRVPYVSAAFDGTHLYQPVTYHPVYWQFFEGPFGVMAINTDGTVAWEFNPGEDTEAFLSSPAVANGTVYVASDLGEIYMLDPSDGVVPIGNHTLDAGVTGGISIQDGKLYTCDIEGKFYCLENE